MSKTFENNSNSGKEAFEYEKYVLMPHSPHNFIMRVSHDGKFKQSRWSVIEKCLAVLKENILTSEGSGEKIFNAVKMSIETYNPHLRCNFNLLEDLCHSMSSSSIWRVEDVFLSIVDAALKLSNFFPESLPLLRMGQNAEVEMTNEQAYCLLANAFLCTFPKRNGHEQYKNYPRINFIELFDDSSNMGTNSWQASARNAKLAKLKCFMNYFSRNSKLSSSSTDVKTTIYERRTLLFNELFHPHNAMQNFFEMVAVPSQMPIRPGSLQVDFANKFVGGGTLGNGSAMEEIKFVTCPALVAAQLFVECLGDRDVLLVHGFEHFSTYTGYSSTFEFQGDFQDGNVSDNHIVAMDANRYQRFEIWKQFEKKNIDRELNKCLCAFKAPKDPKFPSRQAIVSGKWGCGVFNGHPQLKCLIQWMAASLCQVPLELNTFGDVQLGNELNHLADVLQKTDSKVGEIYPLVIEYGRSLKHSRSNRENLSLIEFIMEKLDQSENSISTTALLRNKSEELKKVSPKSTPNLSVSLGVNTTVIQETEKIVNFVSASSDKVSILDFSREATSSVEILKENTLVRVSKDVSEIQSTTENIVMLVEEKTGERTDVDKDKLGSIGIAPAKGDLKLDTLKTDTITKTERTAKTMFRALWIHIIAPLGRHLWSFANKPFRMLTHNIPGISFQKDTKSIQEKCTLGESANQTQRSTTSPMLKSIALDKSPPKPFVITRFARAVRSFLTFKSKQTFREPCEWNVSESEYSDQD